MLGGPCQCTCAVLTWPWTAGHAGGALWEPVFFLATGDMRLIKCTQFLSGQTGLL